MKFTKATKEGILLRMSLIGVAGSGKTYTSLKIATGLGGNIAVIDTEHGSSRKYASEFNFDMLQLEDHNPHRYMEAIREAGKAGYTTTIVDSMSHMWTWMLQEVERVADMKYRGNKFAAWKDVTPLHTEFIETMLGASNHVILTFRAKQEYVQEEDERGRKNIVKKGLGPIAKDGIEYETDIVGELDVMNTLRITKSRASALSGKIFREPGENVASLLREWLSSPTSVDSTAPSVESIAGDKDMHSRLVMLDFELRSVGKTMEAALKHYGHTSPEEFTTEEVAALEASIAKSKAKAR